MMSFHSAIFSYQNICSLLGFKTPEEKLQVERAIKNLLKCLRYARKSAKLHESVLDNLEKTEVQVPQSQEDVRFTDYNMVYVVPIEFYEESKYAFERILDVCERHRMNAQVKVWTRQEFYDLEQIDQKHKTTFMKGTHILCLFIDKLPDTIRERVWFIIKFMQILSQEYLHVSTIYRFDYQGSKDVRFEYRTEGVNAVYFNCEFLHEIRKCIERYKMDDMKYKVDFHWEDNEANFQIAEVATLVNTFNKTIYSEVSAELNHIGEILVEKGQKSAKLHESILDNVEQTSADSAASLADSPASPDTEPDKYIRFKQMFLFQAEKHIRPGILSHLLDVLNVDYEILNINQRELKQIDEWIDDSQFEKLESFNLVLLFINLPDRMYDRAVLMMRIMSAFCQEYGMF